MFALPDHDIITLLGRARQRPTMRIKSLHDTSIQGRYGVVYADPPWRYNDRKNPRGGTHRHYPTMSLDQIAGLPVGALLAPHSMLFLWITMPLLDRAFRVVQAWGFAYKTCAFVWVKTTKTGTDAVGPGHYTRANAELCLLGVRGRPERQSRAVRQIVQAPRGEHSAKPPEVRDRIVALCGNVPRLELFARKPATGWDHWGNGL